MSLGKDILDSQSNTVNLLHPSVPQVPLFLQPFGCPSAPLAQLVQPIFYVYIALLKEKETKMKLDFKKVKIPYFEEKIPISENNHFTWVLLTKNILSWDFLL